MANPIPSTMKAWVYRKSGKVQDVLKLESSYPVPKPTPERSVLVKVHAAALNPVGWKMIQVFPGALTKKPAVPESDFSGVIVAGEGLEKSGFKVGEEIWGIVPADEVAK